MSDYLEYDVNNIICHQKYSNLYNVPGDQALDKVVDLYLTGYTWQLIASWINKSTETETYSQEYSCGYTVTEGTEVDTNWKASGELKGLGVEIGGGTKQFSSQETSTSVKYSQTIKVGPNSTVYFYQKRYTFKPEVWFVLDAWCVQWTVGQWEASGYAHVNECVRVDSSEFLTTGSALSGKSSVACTSQSSLKRPENYTTKQFQDCTRRCQDYLHDRGV